MARKAFWKEGSWGCRHRSYRGRGGTAGFEETVPAGRGGRSPGVLPLDSTVFPPSTQQQQTASREESERERESSARFAIRVPTNVFFFGKEGSRCGCGLRSQPPRFWCVRHATGSCSPVPPGRVGPRGGRAFATRAGTLAPARLHSPLGAPSVSPPSPSPSAVSRPAVSVRPPFSPSAVFSPSRYVYV